MRFWRFRVLAADARKAEGASEATQRISRPPSLTGRLACNHWVSVRAELSDEANAKFLSAGRRTKGMQELGSTEDWAASKLENWWAIVSEMTKPVYFRGTDSGNYIQHGVPVQAVKGIAKIKFDYSMPRRHGFGEASSGMDRSFAASWNSNSQLSWTEQRFGLWTCKGIGTFRGNASPGVANGDRSDAARFLLQSDEVAPKRNWSNILVALPSSNMSLKAVIAVSRSVPESWQPT